MEDMVIIKKRLASCRGLIILTIIFTFQNSEIYANAEIENNQDSELKSNFKKESIGLEELEFFTVDDILYKVIEGDNTVILWNYKKLNESKNIIINNYIKYDGFNYKVRFIYEKAFFR